MKTFHVEVFFPELPSPVASQTQKIHAGQAGVAIQRAMKEIKQRPGVKGRRISTLRVTCVEIKQNANENT